MCALSKKIKFFNLSIENWKVFYVKRLKNEWNILALIKNMC